VSRVLSTPRASGSCCMPFSMTATSIDRIIERRPGSVIVEGARGEDHPAPDVGLRSDRKQELTRLVLQGFSTAEIAQHLTISGHIVQQHLKSVFDKTRARSRRDLSIRVDQVFAA
jgi:DNA-binding CsgD family transcriptional regulator